MQPGENFGSEGRRRTSRSASPVHQEPHKVVSGERTRRCQSVGFSGVKLGRLQGISVGESGPLPLWAWRPDGICRRFAWLENVLFSTPVQPPSSPPVLSFANTAEAYESANPHLDPWRLQTTTWRGGSFRWKTPVSPSCPVLSPTARQPRCPRPLFYNRPEIGNGGRSPTNLPSSFRSTLLYICTYTSIPNISCFELWLLFPTFPHNLQAATQPENHLHTVAAY